jgi:hypothetical protein
MGQKRCDLSRFGLFQLIALWIPGWRQIPHTHSSYCEARAPKRHCIANGRHSKQNSAETKSEGNKRAAGGKYNQSDVPNVLRDLTAEHHARLTAR